jgi:hypothetical protein
VYTPKEYIKMTRTDAAAKATKARSSKANSKCQTAINIMRLYGKDINPHSLAQEAGVHRKTATNFLKKLSRA